MANTDKCQAYFFFFVLLSITVLTFTFTSLIIHGYVAAKGFTPVTCCQADDLKVHEALYVYGQLTARLVDTDSHVCSNATIDLFYPPIPMPRWLYGTKTRDVHSWAAALTGSDDFQCYIEDTNADQMRGNSAMPPVSKLISAVVALVICGSVELFFVVAFCVLVWDDCCRATSTPCDGCCNDCLRCCSSCLDSNESKA